MSDQTSTRPFRVDDQIRVAPRAQDDVSGLWTILGFVEVESGNHIMHLVATGGTLRSVIIVNPERTAATRAAYTIELLTPAEPSPAAQDRGPLAAPLSDRTLDKVLSRPAHVPPGELRERSEVEERVLRASLAWHNADTDDFDALRDTFWAMKDAIADYAKAVQS